MGLFGDGFHWCGFVHHHPIVPLPKSPFVLVLGVGAITRRDLENPAQTFGISQDEADRKLDIIVVDYDDLEKSRDHFSGYNLGFCCCKSLAFNYTHSDTHTH